MGGLIVGFQVSADTRRDAALGAAVGLLGGLASWWALQAQGAVSGAGLLGVDASGGWAVLHLLLSALLGSAFGVLARYQPLGRASAISVGLLYGLLWWAAGPITLGELMRGEEPVWSAQAAASAFPSMIAHLLYGGLLGFGFHVLVSQYLRLYPDPGREGDGRDESKTRVVVLGGGFGGVSAAKHLERMFWRDSNVEVTLISRSNYLLFTPMLAEVAGSALEPQHISCPVRAILPHTRFRKADVERIDTEAQAVHIRSWPDAPDTVVGYDHLVLALGSAPHFFGLPGMEERAFTLKSLPDAADLRNHVLAQLEQADVNPDAEGRRRQLTFVVAGGGFAGAEAIAELFDLVHSVIRFYPNVPPEELRFVLAHSRGRILPELGEGLAHYALRKLRARGIELLLNTRVSGATADGVLVGEGEVIPARTIVWTAGNRPSPILSTIPCERSRGGALAAEDTLRLRGFDNVWVVGDCGRVPDHASGGEACPPTAQHAVRQGKTAARNIAAALRGAPLEPFRFRALGVLMPLGRRTGLAEIRGLRFSGPLAWLMWRGVYLTLLPGLEKKVRVLLDWVIDLFFPRDIVLTSERGAAANSEMSEAPAPMTGPPPGARGGVEG